MTKIIIGSRGSRLALQQAKEVQEQLQGKHPHWDVEIKAIRTKGDENRKEPLPDIGAKGLFTAEIESELLDEKIDIAVHSLKDLPSSLPKELNYAGSPKREDVRDVFISHKWRSVADVPAQSNIATGSVRRRSQFKEIRPDLKFSNLRGNIESRLSKLNSEGWDGIIMAAAALHRLKMEDEITRYLDPLKFVPAVCQGAIGLEIKESREEIKKLVGPLLHTETTLCCEAERSFLARLEGGCSSAIGCWARIEGRQFVITGYTAAGDGSKALRKTKKGKPEDAIDLANQLAEEFEQAGARELIAG